MSNKSENYISSLLTAIDTIVNERLSQVSYDKTIICTIIDDSDAKNGNYFVTDGSVKFWAQSENTRYLAGDQVRVTVLSGDMTQEKFIIGRYNTENDVLPITYVSPLDTVLKISDNLVVGSSSDKKIFKLCANGNVTSELIWETTFSDEYKSLQENQIYDTIFLQADFKTLLSNYNIVSGNYGLVLQLYTKDTVIDCTFDVSHMLGNPYAFSIYTTQAIKFNISDIGNLTGLKIFFRQDNNFEERVYTINERIAVNYDTDNKPIYNLFVKNLQVGFGSDITSIPTKTVRLFTSDDLAYTAEDSFSATKKLNFVWYNKDDNNKYIGFTDGATNSDGTLKLIDEKAYLTMMADNARLKARMSYDIPLDENGLRLAADMKDAYELSLELSDFLGKDLAYLLADFRDHLPSTLHSVVNDFILNYCELQMTDLDVTLSNLAQSSYNFYTEWLNNVAARYNVAYIPTLDDTWQFKGNANAIPLRVFDYYAPIQKLIIEISNNLQHDGSFMLLLKAAIKNTAQEYIGAYELYLARLEDMVNRKLNNYYLSKLEQYYSNSLYRLVKYFDENYTFIKWEEQIASTENAYSVYLYQYDATAPGDIISGPGWYEPAIDINEFIEKGVKITLDATQKTSESFQVIVFFNHEKFTSNILTFTNASEIVNLKNEALSDTISISHGENSLNIYQLYNSVNSLINSADKYRQRKLTISYANADGTIDNTKLLNTQIYWYLPVTNTMLTYDASDFDKSPFTEFNTTSDTFKNGYRCFYKKITNLNTDLDFTYRIKDYYCQSAANNTIYCKVVNADGIEYTSFIFLNFASFGTSGTDYTLVLRPLGNQAALTRDNDYEHPYYLQLELYNYDNERIQLPTNITVDELMNGNIGKSIDASTGQIAVWIDNLNSPVYGAIFEVSATQNINGKNVILKTYYALPYSAEKTYYAEGASTVVYNSNGQNPSYYKGQYVLYGPSEPSLEWKCQYYSSSSRGLFTTLEDTLTLSYLPKLSSNNTLLPATMYVEGGDRIYGTGFNWTQYYSCVLALNGTTILWSQPIFICQNRYASAMLNTWDGELTINEDDNTILASMIGAGRKTATNQFEGVLMGEIKTDTATETGLYGYHQGGQSFGFLTTGTAFIGKSGWGRINFDGEKGEIYSASYQLNATNPYGMHLNVKDGIMTLQNQVDPTQFRTKVRVAQSSPYFDINVTQPVQEGGSADKTGVSLIHIADDSYYLQTEDYKLNESGTKLDLKNGAIDSYNFSLTSKNIIMNSGREASNYFQVLHYSDEAADGVPLLSFGPTTALIQSSAPDTGLSINLDAGSIEAKGAFSLVAGNISIANTGTLLKVGDVLKLDERTQIEPGGDLQGDLYLQSENFNKTAGFAAGMKIDLAKGELEAYSGFTIKAFETDSGESFVISTSGDPWLSVSNVIYMSQTEQYIQTSNYEENSQGMKIDLMQNQINAYGGFALDTENIKINTTGKPWLNINNLLVFDTDNQYIKSQDAELILDFKNSAITIKNTLDLECGDDYTTEYFAIHTKPSSEESYINFEISDKNDENRSSVLRIASNEVVFASPDFYWDDNNPKNNKGIQLSYNHTDGSQLLAANFTLRGVGIEDGKQKSAFRISNEPTGYMRFWTSTTPTGASAGSGTVLFELSETAYALRTPGFGPQSTTGFEIDLAKGSITAKSGFHLSAKNTINDKNYTVNISTAAADYPLNINNAFTVDWDGTTSITSGSFIIGEKNTNGVRSCTFGITQNGEFGSNMIIQNAGKIDHSSSAFSVDSSGYVHACSNGVQINSTGLHMRQGSISIKNNQDQVAFSVTTTGDVTIHDGSIKLNYDTSSKDYLVQLTSDYLSFGQSNVDNGWVSTFQITPTQVAFGPNDNGSYNFTVDNDGTVTITGGNLNMTSGSIVLGQKYDSVLKKCTGAFKVTSLGELYMGYTTKSDMSTVDIYKTYINSEGIANFISGTMTSCTMTSCTMDSCTISGSLAVKKTSDTVKLESTTVELGTKSSTVKIKGNLDIAGSNTITGNTTITGDTTISENTTISGDLFLTTKNFVIGTSKVGTGNSVDDHKARNYSYDTIQLIVDTPNDAGGLYLRFRKGILVMADVNVSTGGAGKLRKKYDMGDSNFIGAYNSRYD